MSLITSFVFLILVTLTWLKALPLIDLSASIARLHQAIHNLAPDEFRLMEAQEQRPRQTSDQVEPLDLVLTATYTSVGIELPFQADDNGNATAELQFKRVTDT